MEELRLALRRLWKRPASTIASIVTLAGAIAAAGVTWSALSAVLLKPLPVPDPDRLVIVGTLSTSGRFAGTLQRGVIYPYYPYLNESDVFERVAAAWLPPMPLLTRVDEATPERVQIAFVTHDFFDVLGVNVPLGRRFDAGHDRRGAAPVAILSDRYWRRAWNASPNVIGRTFRISDTTVTVIGISAPGFRGISLAEAPDVYLPFHTITDIGGPFTNYLAEPNHQSSPSAMVTIVARLREGSSPALAASRLAALQSTDPRIRRTLAVSPLNTEALPVASRDGVSRFSGLLAATVALLLLAGCTTVGLLLLLRTEARREEFAMCMALGATRWRLGRGILLEGTLLAICAAVLSLPLATSLFGMLKGFQLPGGIAIELLQLSLDGRMLAAVAVAALICVAAVSTLACLFGFRASVALAIRSRTGSTAPVAGRAARSVLVTMQVAAALFLLAGAGLFARSLVSALSLNSGIDPARLIPVSIALRPYGYNPERAGRFFGDLRERLAANPAIRSVATSMSPGSFSGGYGLSIDGIRRKFPAEVSFRSVDRHYFDTLGIPLLGGRNFAATDDSGAPAVGIASESFARLLGDGGSAIGRRITMPFSRPPAPAPQVEIVGVVPDVITNVTTMEPLVLYMPIAQQYPIASRELLLRAASDPDTARAEVLSTIRHLDPSVTPAPMYTMQERLGRQMSAQQFGATVLGALGSVAIILTLLGTYVLADSMATIRIREMGIRAALGASRRQLASIVLTETARLIGIGIVAGLGLTWLSASTIRAFLFQVEPLDPMTLGSVAASILLLALVVTLRAAVRAARVDLALVLRSE